MKNLNRSLTIRTDEYGAIQQEGFEVSIYGKGVLIADCSENEQNDIYNRLMNGFTMKPSLLHDTFQIMKEERWTKQKVLDAYKHVLRTHKWNTDVQPAELLSYDKTVKFNTYSEICHKISQYVAIYHKGVKEPLYITVQEQNEFNFPSWDEKYRNKPVFSYEQAVEMAKKQDEYIRGKK